MAKKLSVLNSMLSKFNDLMGDGVVHTAATLPKCRKILSRIPAYNYVTCGGFPIGRVIEHYGENGSLKSYASYKGDDTMRELESFELRDGYKPKKPPVARRVALVDIEATYTPDWGENFGIDNEGLILVRPTLLSNCVDIIQALLESEEISLVVLDSMSAIGTDEEIGKSMEDQQMASGARFWNKACRKFQAAMNSNPTKESTLIVINSAYQKTGIAYGDPEVIRNGEQLKRTKSLSVKFKALKKLNAKVDEGEIVIGRNISIECVKNKVGVPQRSATFFYAYVDYGGTQAYSTDASGQIVDLAMKYNLVERKGSWYDYKDLHVQGIDNFVSELTKSGMLKKLEKEVYREMF